MALLFVAKLQRFLQFSNKKGKLIDSLEVY